MYLKNLLITTGRSPEIKNDHKALTDSNLYNKKLADKGSRLPIAAFLLLVMVILAGCESSGSVGEGLESDEETVNKTILELDNLETIEANTFSGRLQRSSMGYLEDPLYGTLNAVALIKPAISRAQVDTIRDGDSISLKLNFSSTTYGDENAVSEFEIFEAEDVWRGNELRYNSPVSANTANKVGEFQITDEDSIEVELSDEWFQKFRDYHNSTSADRDSLYRTEFPGLAIVPSQTNQRIHFLRHAQEEDDDQGVTEFLVTTPPADEEEEENVRTLDLRDWGSSVLRSNEPESTDGIVLHNSERVLQVDFSVPEEELKNRNIINAQLVFSLRTDVEEVNPNIIRPPVESIRAHTFGAVPGDLVSELFINNPRFSASVDEDENIFRLDITQYILNELYGDENQGSIFVSLQAVNGFLYSTHFYDENAEEIRRPRIVITSVD